MIRTACGFVVALLLASPAAADVTLRQKTNVKAAMGGGAGEGVLYIKGTRMRNDDGASGSTTIVDLASQQVTILNTKRREAEVYNMTKVGADLAKLPISDVQAKVTPTTETRQIAGAACTVHNMDVAVPAEMAGEKITFRITGPVCLSKSAPGQADFAGFYKMAAEKGLFFGDPRAAKAQPGPHRGMSALYREFANLGVPLAQDMMMKFDGSGPMAGMISKLGGSSVTMEVTAISTDTIPDNTFEIPAGYKINKR